MTANPRSLRPVVDDDLPDFGHPPLAEVVLGIQFDPLVRLTSARLGEVWDLFRDRFPNTEDQPPIASAFERMDVSGPSPQLTINLDFMRQELPRCWFKSQDGDEMIQFQQDRFHHNWRRTEGSAYPRYPALRDRFNGEATMLNEFLTRAQIGALVINQCEISYINHIVTNENWSEIGQAGRVFQLLATDSQHDLGPQEHVRFETSFAMVDDNERRGRLHASLVSGILHAGSKRMLALTFTARGAPIGDGVEGALKFLDLGHRRIVQAFADLTTKRMHETWGRTR